MKWALNSFESKPVHDSIHDPVSTAWSCQWIFSIPAMWWLAEVLSPLRAGRSFLWDILELFTVLAVQLSFLAIPESQLRIAIPEFSKIF